MLVVTSINVCLGRTTIESYHSVSSSNRKSKSPLTARYVCVPDTALKPRVLEILPDERIYDLGWRENWRVIAQANIFEDSNR